ncbi:lipopolysaccharide transport system ATP-binding protein [Zunongwangia mangrovi]|uniref:Lipopolysaccharide transport system ATP-binding protein n=1 Tax=Zunongwangia mangrovi TaxID=1334022 RepID=A0A1I1LUH8_9FLAO|nr:ABC transporter ATP-binding protein [Zunongwangia mangrovi]SFC73953.1 lipopolysaccharide transport system ATP-binding protein [Zunongwangia mangrovi]
MSVILKAENISKQYRLGTVGTGTLSHDLNRWWHQIRGKEDPYLKVGAVNDRSAKASEDYVWALRDINFEVKTGEVLGIIGKNGAGKSTLLKLLSRVTSPTTGSIRTKGRIASLLEVGTGFHPELTGRENIYLNGAILGMTKPEIRSKIDEIIAFSGCEMYIDTPVKRYSSGMRVRLGFAVAAHLEPEILVVDEVLAVGDAEFQKKAIGKMQDLSTGEGRTVLFVSHNMLSIEQLCSRCIVLENGTVSYNGKTKLAISNYLAKEKQKDTKVSFPLSSKNIRINHFKVIDNLENIAEILFIGSQYKLNLGLKNIATLDQYIDVRIQFFSNEKLITTLNSYHRNETYLLKENEVVDLLFNIPKLPLSSGRYSLGIQIYNRSEKMVLYEHENFFTLEIKEGDFFKTGRLPHRKLLGKCLIDFDMQIRTL